MFHIAQMSLLKLSAVGVVLYICIQCQSQEYPHVSFNGIILTNHSYVDLSLVNGNAHSVSCHTDLQSCCRMVQGPHRGDWYFPNGTKLGFSTCDNCKIYEDRGAQRVELYRRNNGNTSGIYHCETPTIANSEGKDYVYIGLYYNGDDITMSNGLKFAEDSNFSENKLQFTLSAISTGGPATTVTWMRNSVVITGGPEQESQSILNNTETAEYIHSLTVKVEYLHTFNVSERLGGVYTCTVSNRKPSDDSSSLRVQVASAPRNLTLKQHGETSINVSWTPANPLYARYNNGYRIFYTNNSIDVTRTFSNTTILITNLKNGQSYNISVISLSIHLPSEPLTSTLYLASLPKDVEVNVTTATETFISLSVYFGNYNEKVNYTAFVTWRKLHPACRNSTLGTNIEDIDSVLVYNITELDAGSSYDITVVIFNAAGNATSNRVTMETEEAAPSAAPISIAISAALFNVTVMWKPVDCVHRNGNITGYSIQYHMRGSGVPMYVNTSSLQYTIFELQPSTEYIIGVAAVNNAGIGVYENLNVSTLPFVVSVVSTTSTTVTISWDYVNNETKAVDISWRMSMPSMCGGDTSEKRNSSSAPPHVITELEEYRSYNITVCIEEDAICDSITIITNESAPSAAPTNLSLVSVTSSSISIQWGAVPCAHRNGNITGYSIQYHMRGSGVPMYVNTSSLQYTILELQPATEYIIGVAAVNNAGIGVYENLNVSTLPFVVSVVSTTSTTVTISWDYVNNETKAVDISWRMSMPSMCVGDTSEKRNSSSAPPHVITELEEYRSYNITVCTEEDAICDSITIITNESAPSAAPTNLSLVSVTSSSISIQWGAVPCAHHNGNITGSVVSYKDVKEGSFLSINVSGDQNKTQISGLKPSTQYELHVAAVNSVGTGPFTNQRLIANTLALLTDSTVIYSVSSPTVTTSQSDDGKQQDGGENGAVVGAVVSTVIIVGVTVGIIAVLWLWRRKQSKNSPFPASHFRVLPKQESLPYSEDNEGISLEDLPNGEILVPELDEVEAVTVPTTAKPDSKQYGLEDSTAFDKPTLSENPDMSFPLSKEKEDNMGPPDNENGSMSKDETPAPKPPCAKPPETCQPVATFGNHVEMSHSNNNQPFISEFESLTDGEGKLTSVARSPQNRKKNRFRNISAYDDNRVILTPLEDLTDDYMNASYMNGYSKQKRFIAAQGPLPTTLVDFWRMIWQEKVPSVVMITNLVEGKKTKCEQYWPTSGSEAFGPFQVTITKQLILADYTIRTLSVELSGKVRRVTQFHYTAWPDHGVPDYATSILSFHKTVMREQKTLKGPILVHCSAGVGRTGTFITLDHVLDQIEREGIVDIPAVIQNLRQQRTQMVQTTSQYIFIHDAILESVTCGDTRIEAGDLRRKLTQLHKKDESGRTGLDLQFSILDQVSTNAADVKAFTARNNPTKNRSTAYLPVDKWRVVLKGEVPDYINATCIHGYKQHMAFIITQGPMQSTSRDFWKMVFSRKCSVIVMLSDLVEEGQEVCYQYWPGERCQSYGEFRVELMNEEDNSGYVLRTFCVQHAKFSKSHQVHQFHISGWNVSRHCGDVKTVIAVIDEIARVQRRTGNSAIVVHGVDTVSRSAIFCAISTTIERCKTEGVVDVFQVVKAMRVQKPGAVCTMEQYQSIYEALLVFLDSFDTYANFVQ